MSVIQDALRRKLDEQRMGEPAQPAAPVKAPPQTPPLAQQVLQHQRPGPAVRRPAAAPEATVTRPRPAAGRRDDQFTIWLLVTAILVMLTAAFVGALMYFLNAQPLRLTATQIQPSPPPPEATAAATASSPGPTDDASASAAEPAPAAKAPEPGWPTIQVGGTLTAGGNQRASAILNGRMVKANRMIDGVRLVGLSEEGVTLEFRGERRFVETGQSTGP